MTPTLVIMLSICKHNLMVAWRAIMTRESSPGLRRMMAATGLSDELEEWCKSVLGRCRVVSTHGHAHGESLVWRLDTGQRQVYLKVHRRPVKWAAEVHAYERWIPVVPGLASRLEAVIDSPVHAILLAELPGCPMHRVVLPDSLARSAWRAAGAVLSSLHGLSAGRWFGVPSRDGTAVDDKPESDPVNHLLNFLEPLVRCTRDQGLLEADQAVVAQHAVDSCDVFAGEQPRPCHGDYRPRNWIVGFDGAWRGVIDFEHARWDLKMCDLGSWWDRELCERDDLKRAFLQGYGELTEREQKQLFVGRVLASLTRVLAGHRCNDDDIARAGYRALGLLGRTVASGGP